jgi:hypothetical protein
MMMARWDGHGVRSAIQATKIGPAALESHRVKYANILRPNEAGQIERMMAPTTSVASWTMTRLARQPVRSLSQPKASKDRRIESQRHVCGGRQASGQGRTAANRDRIELRDAETLGTVGVLGRLEEEDDPRV